MGNITSHLKIVFVTSLDNDGPETFREAIEGMSGPRLIVMPKGEIRLTKPLTLEHDRGVTILGMDGSSVVGHTFMIKKCFSIIIFRVAFKLGMVPNGNWDTCSIIDSVEVWLKDCAFLWGIDECLDLVRVKYAMIEGCVIAEPLRNPRSIDPSVGHSIGPHPLVARFEGEDITVKNCLVAHQEFRPVLKGRRILYQQIIQYNCGSSYPIMISSGAPGPYELVDVYLNTGPDTHNEDPQSPGYKGIRVFRDDPRYVVELKKFSVMAYGDCYNYEPAEATLSVQGGVVVNEPGSWSVWDGVTKDRYTLDQEWRDAPLFDDDARRVRDDYFNYVGSMVDQPPS